MAWSTRTDTVSEAPFGVVVSLVACPPPLCPLSCTFLASNQTSEFHFQASNIPMVTSRPMFWRKATPRKTTIPSRFPVGLGIGSLKVHTIDTSVGSGHPHFRTGWYAVHTLLAIAPRMAQGNGHMAPGRMARFPRYLQPSPSLI